MKKNNFLILTIMSLMASNSVKGINSLSCQEVYEQAIEVCSKLDPVLYEICSSGAIFCLAACEACSSF
jgi:hypothetical protein